MSGDRAILHVDMDAFFASVEQRDDPRLMGRPVVVGHDGPRGVVAAASYEARAFGCHSAQPVAAAKRCCSELIVVPGRREAYAEASRLVFAVFGDVTPLVEPLSIDEAFLDVTGSTRLLGPPRTIARLIKARIREATDLTASVGVAPNKFLAKLASETRKPDGMTVIGMDDVEGWVAELPIGRMWGVGPATEAKLRRLGVRAFGDLHRWSCDEAGHRLGRIGAHCWRLAHGIDDRVVTPDHRAKSIGHEQTFGVDVAEPEHVRSVLLAQTESVGRRLRRHDLRGRTVTVKIRYGDFETITRSHTFADATNVTRELWSSACELYDRWAHERFRPVRLIGVAASHLEPSAGRQLELFADQADARQQRLDSVTDRIKGRFGARSIHRGLSAPDAPT